MELTSLVVSFLGLARYADIASVERLRSFINYAEPIILHTDCNLYEATHLLKGWYLYELKLRFIVVVYHKTFIVTEPF